MTSESGVSETGFEPHWAQKMYEGISPETKLQFSETGGPHFFQNHNKLNQIKPSNLKKFLDPVGVWSLEIKRFHLSPKILSKTTLDPISTNMTHFI